jgi:hypothetical protein
MKSSAQHTLAVRIENPNERIQPHLADHPLRLGASMVSSQKGKWTPRFFETGVEY